MSYSGVDRRKAGRFILPDFRHGAVALIVGLVLFAFSGSINSAAAGDTGFSDTTSTYSIAYQTGNGIVRGMAWVDVNGNGLRDTGENGRGSVAVTLFRSNGTTFGTTTTASNGLYEFNPVSPGDYYLEFATVAGHRRTPQDANSNASNDIDSDASVTNGRTATFTITAPSGATVTINPTAVNTYLTNPGIGWQDKFGDFLLPETVVYPERANISWLILNPSEGSYNWSALDSRMNSAAAQGKQISFRVYTMQGEDFGGHHVPQWVLNKGATLSAGEPVYANCVYQTEWSNFVNAMIARYDGNPNIAFIDISGYGEFNEWGYGNQTEFDDTWASAYNNGTATQSSFNTVDGETRRRLTDLFIGGSYNGHRCRTSTGTLTTVNYSYAGFQQTQLIMPYAGIRQATQYTFTRRKDVGFRHDCLGRSQSNTQILGQLSNEIAVLWPQAPITF